MKIFDSLRPGSDEWRAVRLRYRCASEAPAAMGASRHLTRGELMRLKATGHEREFSDYVQQRILNKGHETEALARVITEEMTGETLYAVAALSDSGEWLSTFDGIPMSEDWVWEHKLWNEELAAAVRANDLPPAYFWQLEHQLLTCETAEYVLFVCSDGTRERRVEMRYFRVPGRAQQLIAGWKQFDADTLALDLSAPPAPQKPAAQPLEQLPAISVRLDGSISVTDTLEPFGVALKTFVNRIPKKPSTDQEFSDCEEAVKRLKHAEEMLEAEERRALASIEPVEAMRRMVADFLAIASAARLATDKLVKARKTEIKTEQIDRGRKALQAHHDAIDARLGGRYMPAPTADFAAALRNLKKWDALREAIDTTLALAKVQANRLADETIAPNLATLASHVPNPLLGVLFRDLSELIVKPPDDFRAIVAHRMAEHAKTAAANPAATAPPAAWSGMPRPAAQNDAGGRETAQVIPMQPQAARGPLTPENSINLTNLNDLWAPVKIDSEGLATLGFPFVRLERGSKLYYSADIGAMCAAMMRHLERVKNQPQAAA